MPAHSPPPDVDWRPYRFTAIALMLALLLNAYTRNGQWAAYTGIGSGIFLVIFSMVREGKLVLHPPAVWMVGIAMALHYIGGSFSGVHTVGGPNGLYYAFPWWDNVVHFLGSWAVAVAAAVWIRGFAPSRAACILLSVAVATAVGALVEIYEFVQFVLFDTVDQGFYVNTLLDLYYNLLGASAGAYLYTATPVVVPPTTTAST